MKYLRPFFILFNLLFLLNFNSGVNDNSIYSNEKNPAKDNWVRDKLKQMTLREKIGQMIVSNTFGEDYDEQSKEFLRLKSLCTDTKVGGFIFFKGTAEGYTKLSNKLQRLSSTPLLISSDFERGTAMRVTDGLLFPNNMAIGATRNPELAYKMGLSIAKDSRTIGVNQNYSPVCDVNNNQNNPIINVRSFGEDPLLVSQMSEMMIKGLQDGNVIATAKHFPGHGDTEIDSHKDLPVINFTHERLEQIELVPFKNAVNIGVRAIMAAHLSIPSYEQQPNVPSSLSGNIINGLLRTDLGFDGLVVTDALNMQGITKYFSTEDVAVMCVKAGVDLILMPLDENATVNAIESAVTAGNISEQRIDESVTRILNSKSWLGLNKNKLVNETGISFLINKDTALAQKIADESITIVKDDNSSIPLKRTSNAAIIFNISDGKDNINSTYFPNHLDLFRNNGDFPNPFMTSPHSVIDVNSEIDENTINTYIEQAQQFQNLIICIYAKVKFGTGKISILPSHVALINSLSKLNNNPVVISFGNPYLLKEFPEVPCYVCAYGDADVSINASLKVLTGQINPKGKLPVSITNVYKYGTGITK